MGPAPSGRPAGSKNKNSRYARDTGNNIHCNRRRGNEQRDGCDTHRTHMQSHYRDPRTRNATVTVTKPFRGHCATIRCSSGALRRAGASQGPECPITGKSPQAPLICIDGSAPDIHSGLSVRLTLSRVPGAVACSLPTCERMLSVTFQIETFCVVCKNAP